MDRLGAMLPVSQVPLTVSVPFSREGTAYRTATLRIGVQLAFNRSKDSCKAMI